MRTLRLCWRALATCVLCGCGASQPATDLDVRRAQQASLAQLLREWSAPCPAAEPVAEASSQDQVFVETLLFELPTPLAEATTLQTLPELPRSSNVTFLGSPHVIASFGEPLRINPSETGAMTEAPKLVESSLLPRHADLGRIVLSWELGLQPVEPPPRKLQLHVSTRAGELGLAHVPWDDSRQRSVLLLFKTQTVHGEADLRRIFECKMWQRRAATQTR